MAASSGVDEMGQTDMSLAEQINKAIGAHGMWKQRLRSAIESGKSEFTIADTGRDNLCEFGKWLYGTSLSAADKASVEYKLVRDLHARFHQSAAKVLSRALAGDRAGAEASIGNAGEFTSVSADLTRAMMGWKAKVGA